jgi:hypothetical protein
MSNKDFPGISNDQLFKNLYSSDIKSTNLQASSLTCDSLSFSGTYPIANLTGAVSRAFTTDEISSMSKKGHLFIHSLNITTPDAQLTLGPDTADRANELLAIFGITDTTTKRCIRITPCVTSHATLAVKIKNDNGTNVSVQVALNSSANANPAVIPATGKGEAYILVSKPAANQILFDVVCQSAI